VSAGDQDDARRPVGGIGSGTWVGFRPVQARRPFEEAVDQIADAIRAGTLHVGDRLPSERVLAEQMRISRPTLREAIRILSEADVLESRRGAGGGTFVKTAIVPRALVDDRFRLRLGEIAGVLAARRLLEPRIAQLASLYATEEDFEEMRGAIELVRTLGRERYRLFQLDTRFHLTMARATHNDTVVELARLLFRRLEVVRDLIGIGGEVRWTIDIHERTLRAIMAGDLGQIDATMDEHLARLEQRWEEHSGRALVRAVPSFLLPSVALPPTVKRRAATRSPRDHDR
jgi:GntR family transcriptional repressor for pyruvate dehydrogenase complex